MSLIISSLVLYVVAGLVNGSFVVPIKYIKKWNFENIWLLYSLWAFLILPWLSIIFLIPQILEVYRATPMLLMVIAILGGFLFGIGQVAVAIAIHMIGIGLAFVVCLGISTGLGFLLPLVIQHPDRIMTPFGYMTMIGTALAIFGFIFSTYAGKLRDKIRRTTKQYNAHSKHFYFFGIFLAVLAGLFSAGQNLCFVLTEDMQTIAIGAGVTPGWSTMTIWPIFLTFSFIPYAAYMIFLLCKNSTFACYRASVTKVTTQCKYCFFTFIMGLFWYSSIIFYSKATQLGGSLGPIIGWPMFMVLIIFTSNFWSWFYKEWKDAGRFALINLLIGLFLLIASAVILAIIPVPT